VNPERLTGKKFLHMKAVGMEKWACGGKTHGFTLIEVLVALVITGMAVTVFFQILSSGIRLEFTSAQRTGDVVNLKQAFEAVISRDVQDRGFEWQGEYDHGSWSLQIEQAETLKTHVDADESLNIDTELYRYVFEYKSEDGREWTLVRYAQYEPDFFSEDFKNLHFH
jgi:prepilin-type N-terminal cleavage/methylation domain-containing protein